jgi:hypothetical protein
VFVTGYVYSGDETQGVTLGFDAATGEQRWLRSFPGSAYDMAATPDGRRVFVTGAQLVKTPTGTRVDGVTIAYDGATGAPVWARSVTDPEWHAYGIVNHRIATNADGSRVVVAASRTLREGPSMGITVSLVVTTYDGAAKPDPAAEGTAISQADYPTYGVLPAGLVLNRKGNRAYLNEWSNEYGTQVLTIGVDTNRGRVLWSHRFAGVNGYATFSFPWYYQPIALSPDEQTVYVAGYEGYVNGTVSGFDLAAIWADTGFRKWEQARTSGNTTVCWGCGPSITVSREGQIVMAGRQPAVFAYQSAAYGFNPNGGLLWTRVFRDGRTATWNALTPAPDANRVYIAGSAGTYTATATDRSVDIVVAAYEAA